MFVAVSDFFHFGCWALKAEVASYHASVILDTISCAFVILSFTPAFIVLGRLPAPNALFIPSYLLQILFSSIKRPNSKFPDKVIVRR